MLTAQGNPKHSDCPVDKFWSGSRVIWSLVSGRWHINSRMPRRRDTPSEHQLVTASLQHVTASLQLVTARLQLVTAIPGMNCPAEGVAFVTVVCASPAHTFSLMFQLFSTDSPVRFGSWQAVGLCPCTSASNLFHHQISQGSRTLTSLPGACVGTYLTVLRQVPL